MYNVHPTSAVKRSVYQPKTATSVRDGKLLSGSRLENGLGRWVLDHGGKERMTSDHS